MVRLCYLFILFFPIFVWGQKSDTLVWEDEFGANYTHGSISYHYFLNHPELDPFVGVLSSFYKEQENKSHQLRSTYNYKEGRAILRCDKIYTFCKIKVNNELVLVTNSAFHPWEVDITEFLNSGPNNITAEFTPALQMSLDTLHAYTYPAPNDESNPQIASMVRKPQFMFGWDWAPRMSLLGFLKEVIVEQESPLFTAPYVQLVEANQNIAIIERCIDVQSDDVKKLLWKVEDEEKWINVVDGKATWVDTLNNANYWKPGQPNTLYKENWRFRNKSFERYVPVQYGLRSVELVQEKDTVGTPFYFKVNNKFVFCKGSNVVPLDVFPERVENESLRNLVYDAHEANMNMLRVWGGGDYLPDYFYDLCDSLGIMVWQDFMFACAMYPSDRSFMNSVEKEALYQIKRLRKHPCVVYFNGNNEVDVAWKNWGFQGQAKYKLTEEAQQEIENSYKKLFKELLPKLVSENSDIPYVHTSPLSNWGTAENFKHGTMHYWGVWHGNDSLQELWKQIGRFNAEFGFQSFPSPYAMSQVTTKENWSLDNAAIEARQKSYIGSAKIEEFIKREYGTYSNFSDFVYKSQLVQSKGVGGALVAQRLKSPTCGGSLFWQFNDCWPAPTWSAIDYYGERKALFYDAKRVFAPQTIVRDPNQNSDFYVLKDENDQSKSTFTLCYYSFKGVKLDSNIYFTTDEAKQKLPVDVSLGDVLVVSSESQRFIFILNEVKSTKGIDSTAVEISKLMYNESSGKGVLYFNVNRFTAHLQFYSEKYPLIFADNFQHFLPGEYTVEFELRKDAVGIKLEDIQYHYIQY